MNGNLPMEARTVAALVSSGCAISASELDSMPQSQVERLMALNDVRKVIEFGLEMTL